MGWQGPNLTITSVHADRPTVQVATIKAGKDRRKLEPHTFTATGTGFDSSETQLFFVQPTAGALEPWQVIPCQITKVDDVGNDQKITFTASLYERGRGPYHLVACNRPVDAVNQTAVLEYAISVSPSPDAKQEDQRDRK